MPTLLRENEFFANAVPLSEGENIIKAIVTDSAGNTAVSSVSVISDPQSAQGFVLMRVFPESGLAPLKVSAEITYDAQNPVTESLMTWTGPAEPRINAKDSENYDVTFGTPGHYSLIFRIKDDQGNEYRNETMIDVFSQDETDALFKGIWNEMRQALMTGDTELAVSYFISERRDAYRMLFQSIPADKIPLIIPPAENTEMVGFSGKHACYVIDIEVVANGETKTFSSYLIFEKDTDDLWRIVFF
jgi:hypothetical protein